MADWRESGALAAILALQLTIHLLLSSSIHYVDEGHYLTYAWLTNKGWLIYRDFFDHHSPGLPFLCALAFSILGETFQTGRLLTAIFQLGITLLVFLISKKMFGPGIGLSASLAYALSEPIYGGLWMVTEPFYSFFLAASVLALSGGRGAPNILLSGLLIGIAILFKQSAIWALPAFALYLIFEKRPIPSIAFLFLGASIPPLCLAAYFAWQGALGDLIYGTIGYNFFVIGSKTLGVPVPYELPWLLPLAAVGGYSLLTFRKGNALLLAWFFAALLDSFPEFRIVRLLPSLAPVSVLFALAIRTPLKQPVLRGGLIGLTVPVLFFLALAIGLAFPPDELDPTHALIRASEYVASHTQEDEPIFAAPFLPGAYFFSKRLPASRYLFYGYWGTTEEMQAETIAALEEKKPRFVLYSEDPNLPYHRLFKSYAPLIEGYIWKNYRIEGNYSLPNWDLFVLRRI